jgi:arginine/lysine/ornithine decarboxylase
MDAGADLVVTSVHKMGSAIEQSSVFHLRGDLVDPVVLKQREDLLGTTSSSSLIYATLDGWRRQMVEQGEQLLGVAIERANRIRDRVGTIPGLRLMGEEVLRPQGAFQLDPLRFAADVRGLGISGYQAGDWLRAACHVDVGSADACRIGWQITHADDDETERRLVEALQRLGDEAGHMEGEPQAQLPSRAGLELENAMIPRDAFFGPAESVPARQAVGRIGAEMLSPYPPGVPVVAPGEVISADAVDYLTTGAAAGALMPDAADPSLATIRVVARRA